MVFWVLLTFFAFYPDSPEPVPGLLNALALICAHSPCITCLGIFLVVALGLRAYC